MTMLKRIGKQLRKIVSHGTTIIKNNPVPVKIFTFTSLLISFELFLPYSILAPLVKILSDTSASKIYEKFIEKNPIDVLYEILLPQCDLPNLVGTVDPIEKIRKFEVFLGSLENIHEQNLQDSLIQCFVTIVYVVYSKNTEIDSQNFYSLIQALLNALKKRWLSRRIFDLIVIMLERRGVPVSEILKHLD